MFVIVFMFGVGAMLLCGLSSVSVKEGDTSSMPGCVGCVGMSMFALAAFLTLLALASV